LLFSSSFLAVRYEDVAVRMVRKRGSAVSAT
jgi:hypothetical protein